MAAKGIEMGLALVLAFVLWNGASAQSSCTTALAGLYPCLAFVTGNSSTPSSSCCSQLGSIVQTQPRCLCTLLNGANSSIVMSINQTLALSLPGVCKVQTPPASQCNAANAPSASASAASTAIAPADSNPADSSDETPEITPSQSEVPSEDVGSKTVGVGSKTVPSNTGAIAGGSTINSPFNAAMVFVLLFIATFASTATKF